MSTHSSHTPPRSVVTIRRRLDELQGFIKGRRPATTPPKLTAAEQAEVAQLREMFHRLGRHNFRRARRKTR